MASPIRVVLADYNQLYRTGVKAVLCENENIVVVGEAGSFEQLESLLGSNEKPDVLIVNLEEAESSLVDVITKLVADYPNLPIVAIGTLSEEVYAARELRAGGAAYLRSNCSPSDLVDAVQVVRSGRMYLTSQGSTSVIEQLQNRNAHKAPHSCLSDREYQIFNLICRGIPLVKIGQQFGISVKTVSTYRARILKKMNLSNNAELVQYAVRHKIVESMPA